ncbi:hypothetical protein PFUGPA_05444 [Plasmodium falciparum Palo Alto/Uganda]|uniref:Uncharacterized protein n=1 Tax=Plasmodium falciparum (isolate Palo Alto / Uganda) TaxID=57270 RepID=W4IT12_PLAFP|nr:hypothetical protein PFUGPA_05444 [Plasmodium falciparum Palo Alto/Uganda]
MEMCNDPVPEYIKYEYLFNVDDDPHEDNDYEEHFHMLDEILNDDEDLPTISSLSSLQGKKKIYTYIYIYVHICVYTFNTRAVFINVAFFFFFFFFFLYFD